jgi:hypothetical protein
MKKYIKSLNSHHVMVRGRPVKSAIRQNISEILFYIRKGYGYDIYRIYLEIFPKVTLRSIYYHLRKGVDLGEFEIDGIEKEEGDYSWGQFAEKIYYRPGSNMVVNGDERVSEHFKKDGE